MHVTIKAPHVHATVCNGGRGYDAVPRRVRPQAFAARGLESQDRPVMSADVEPILGHGYFGSVTLVARLWIAQGPAFRFRADRDPPPILTARSIQRLAPA